MRLDRCLSSSWLAGWRYLEGMACARGALEKVDFHFVFSMKYSLLNTCIPCFECQHERFSLDCRLCLFEVEDGMRGGYVKECCEISMSQKNISLSPPSFPHSSVSTKKDCAFYGYRPLRNGPRGLAQAWECRSGAKKRRKAISP